MKKKISYFIIAIAFIGILPVQAQTKVVKATATKANNYGIQYSLPKTILEIEVEYTETIKTAGQYARYASRYLGLSDKEVNFEDITVYSLDEINVKDGYLPNTEKSYLVSFKTKTTAPFVYLTEDGVLCTINAEYTPESSSQYSQLETNTQNTYINPQSIFNEEYLQAGSTGKMAEIAAKNIYSLRESRQDILTGQADNMPGDGKAMEIVLGSLNQQEKLWMELFTGTTEIKKHKKIVKVEPNTELEKEVLFRFSKYLGVVDSEDLSGMPVYANLKDLKTVEIPEQDPKRAAKEPESLVYNLPGTGELELYYGNEQIYRAEHIITQFGTTQILADKLFEDKNKPVKIHFYPNTGAVRQIIQ